MNTNNSADAFISFISASKITWEVFHSMLLNIIFVMICLDFGYLTIDYSKPKFHCYI